MRIIRILIILIVVTVSGIIVNSCCDGFHYKWTYIITENFEVEHRTRDTIVISDSILKDYYGIKVHLFERKYACNMPNLFVNDLYAAYDCWEIYIMEDSIMDLKIITINKFNAEKDQGANVSDSFLGHYSGAYESEGISINELINRINSDDMTVVDRINLFLNDNSVNNSVHQFVVQVLLSDNRILIDTTEAVKLY